MRERLIELLNFVKCNAECCASLDGGRCGELDYLDRCQIEAIADHLLADGVIVPPCKVGDVVYDLTFGEVNAYVVEKMNFKYTPNGLECEEVNAMGKYGLIFNFNNIGKTVFLTREEAEQGLNNIENRNS